MNEENTGKNVEKFVPNSKNGDKTIGEKCADETGNKGISQINMDRIKTTFTGMSKEELMKFANDPFWIRIRWFLFISFWVLWALTLLGAVFIIVATPKCSEPTRTWWEESPIYEINVQHLQNGGIHNYNKTVLEFLNTKLKYLKNMGIQTILLRSVLSSTTAEEEIVDYQKVNTSFGTVDDVKEFVAFAKELGIYVLLAFTPNHSSDKNVLFVRSVIKEDIYKDFYVWKSSDDKLKLPNNWLSLDGGSSWSYNNDRKEFYLHQFKESQPDFNFRNPKVVEYFSNVFKYWLLVGIRGFQLDKTEYLIEDADFHDESIGIKPGYGHDEYKFYNHRRTYNLPESTELLKKWNKIIANYSGIMGISGAFGDYKEAANFILHPLTLSPNFTAATFNNTVIRWIQQTHFPAWKWHCESKIEEDCFPENVKDGLLIVSYLLPGVPVIHLGQELGYPYDYVPSYTRDNGKNAPDFFKRMQATVTIDGQADDPESHFNIHKFVMELRKSPTISFGDYSIKVLNETVFCFTRMKPGNPGYLVAWNLADESVDVDVTNMKAVPNELTIVVKSGHHQFKDNYSIKLKISGSSVNIPSKAAIVLSFVPVQN